MPVYDILANQVLPEPITNYYRGKAIRQDLKLKKAQTDLMEQEIADAPARREADLEELRRKREAHQIKLEENARNAFNFTEEQRTAANERLEPVFDEYRDHGDVGKLQEAIILALKQSPEPIRDAFMDNYFGADKVLDEGEAAKWASLYYKSKDEGSQRETEIRDYMETFGVPRGAAIDLVDKNLDVTNTTDELGFITVTNRRTKEAYKLPGRAAQEAGLLGPETPHEAAAEQGGAVSPEESWAKPVASIVPVSGLDKTVVRETQQKMSLIDEALVAYEAITPIDVLEASGSMNIMQRGANGLVQAITLNTFPRFAAGETDAKNKVELFNQSVRGGLVNSPRFPVWEQQVLMKLLPDSDNVFNDPEGEAIKLSNILRHLQQSRENAVARLEGRPARVVQRVAVGIQEDPIPVLSEEDAMQYPTGTWVLIPGAGGPQRIIPD